MGTAGAAALLERIGGAYGKTGWDKPAVSWQQERLPLHDLLALIVIEVAVCSCLALARPLLEYCIQFWSPECRRDIDKLEATEQGAPRLNRAGILAMRERVMELGFFRERWLCVDMAQHPCTSEQVFEKTGSGTSQRYVAGK